VSAARGPAILVEVERNKAGRYVLRVNDKPIPCKPTVTREKVAEMRRSLRNALERLVGKFLQPPSSLGRKVWDAFDAYTLAGNSLMISLFEHNPPEPFPLVKALNQAYGMWKAGGTPVRMTVLDRTDEFPPLELLPVFSTSDWPEAISPKVLTEEMRRFPAFSAVVRRQLPDVNPPPDGDEEARVLENYQRLPLRFIWNDALDGAALEAEFFEGLPDAIDLAGPWPEQPLSTSALRRQLAGHLWNARGRTTAGTGATKSSTSPATAIPTRRTRSGPTWASMRPRAPTRRTRGRTSRSASSAGIS